MSSSQRHLPRNLIGPRGSLPTCPPCVDALHFSYVSCQVMIWAHGYWVRDKPMFIFIMQQQRYNEFRLFTLKLRHGGKLLRYSGVLKLPEFNCSLLRSGLLGFG